MIQVTSICQEPPGSQFAVFLVLVIFQETEIKSMCKLRRVDIVSKHLHANSETMNGNEFPLRCPGSDGKRQLLPVQESALT